MACKCVLNKFCCCGSLRLGTLVAAISAIVFSIIGIIAIPLLKVKLSTIVLDWLPPLVVKIIIIINLIMTIIISILMIVGVIKRNMYLMAPWVILGFMLAIGLLVSILMTSINFYIEDDTLNGSLWLGLGLVAFVVYCYMWLVAFSFFYVIYQESGRGAYTKDPFRRQY
ncbi:uncharacterized protein LOC109596943 [Aethina tumida]|uniref:uncharacterized protein LOC109596943 n=1 Tax=Aethina tumida TaxID=116153 RepID=UPI00096B263C|nr:uncharacterized protein LOC109596943 [Aethina tumida]XP_019868108.1 uncharacterized protein LOC109596943 [Aethina tumida]